MDSLLNLQEKVAKLLLSCQLDVFVFDLGFSWTLTPDEGARAPKACENKYKKTTFRTSITVQQKEDNWIVMSFFIGWNHRQKVTGHLKNNKKNTKVP